MPEENSEKITGAGASSRCVKCGTCQTACPVFAVRPEEPFTARGKMALVEAVVQGHLAESPRYREYLETCLLCGACEEICPNNVQTLSSMLCARENLAGGQVGMKTGKRIVLKHVVGSPRLLDRAMKAGRTLLPFLFQRIPHSSGIRRRIPLPLVEGDRTFPSLADRFFTDAFAGEVRSGTGPRVGIFAGCMTNYFYPVIGEGIIQLLSWSGASVFVPEDQVCCGMPALTGGARETVRDLAVRNLEAFEKYELDHIVTGCGSCGGNLKENYDAFLEEAGIEERRREAFVSSVLDINEYLSRKISTQEGDHEEGDSPPGLTVTYHHPCHLGRLQGVREQPIGLIRSLPGVRYVPMDEADRCCGMGGSFSLEHYDISREVNDRKVARILETGAEAVVTSCPACIMHIRDGLRRNGREGIEVLHITDLLCRFAFHEKKGADEAPRTEPVRDQQVKKAG